MSDTEPEATFEDALNELVRIFVRKGVSMDEIAEVLETAALQAGEDEDDTEVGGDAA
jgi:hypothetical protein